jgi:hypothetical protein
MIAFEAGHSRFGSIATGTKRLVASVMSALFPKATKFFDRREVS